MTDSTEPQHGFELRKSLVAAIAATRAAISADPAGNEERMLHALRELAFDYADTTPVVMVSRCPFSGSPVFYPMDIAGLDGPYWDPSGPIRYLPERPATVVAITGTLAGVNSRDPEEFETPTGRSHTLHPSVLGDDGTKAVLSSIDVGPHRALLTTYFQYPVTIALANVPELGTHRRLDWGPDGVPAVELNDESIALDDTQLAWLDDERIGWIDPHDEDWIVQSGRDGFPFTPAGSR